jgi:N-acyl-D-amino-acid deacylase
LTLFDEETVDEVATYENPIALSKGIHTVIVNGDIVWNDGKATGARPGRVLSRPLN